MNLENDFAKAIRQRDIAAIVRLMVEGNPPSIKSGFKTETELWDFKVDCPRRDKASINAWANLAKDILAFHNQRGGVIIFGIGEKDFSFRGASTFLDSKLVNDKLRKFLGDRIWIDYHREYIQENQRYLGFALIPPRGPIIERFRIDAPVICGEKLSCAGDSAIREGDSSRVLRKKEVDELCRTLSVPTIGKIYEIDEPCFRILSPEYIQFVVRSELCKNVETALKDRRTNITSLIGIGGVGKTALATWAVLRAYERNDFEFIVSMTAKDRELTSMGIQALEPKLTSFESLLDNILEVTGFPEIKSKSLETKEKEVRSLIEDSNGLLYVDNLETVDDTRIINFLDTLPVGIQAITTSRRTNVRVSVFPVDIVPFSDEENIKFIDSLASQSGFAYVSNLSNAEKARIGSACDGIPLAIRWVLAKAKSAEEAFSSAEDIINCDKKGEELLEFCFRGIFHSMPSTEKAILQVLSLFQRPLSTEAILIGAGFPDYKLLDAIETLVADALVQRFFDPDINDYSYTLLPITRSFVYAQVRRDPKIEESIRQKLSNWFEATDIKDLDERLVIREVRQGKGSSESALIDLALAAERRGDFPTAEELYDKALRRDPNSWKAAQLFGEFYRHKLKNITKALQMYAQSAQNTPRRGSDRARIFREWGLLLRDSGSPDATDRAIEKFEIALVETPNDPITINALAHMKERKGQYYEVIRLLEPLVKHPSQRTREKILPILLRAYEKVGEILKAEELRRELCN